ncbi:MAG: cytochrome c oxidase subunit 3 [Planctomycetota bacterium]
MNLYDSSESSGTQMGRSDSKFWPPFSKGESLPGAGVLGMWLFLASLAMPFFTAIVAFVVMRAKTAEWLPPNYQLPTVLWVSTGVLLVASFAVHVGYRAVRADRVPTLRRAMACTLIAAVVFSICQFIAWFEIGALHDNPDKGGMYVASFYLLTVLHAAHVVGGLVLQGWVTFRAYAGHYWSFFHPGVTYSMMYWHFMDVMWLLLFGTLLLGS